MKKQIVLLPITVPASGYCFDGIMACEHFSNEGGHPSCNVGFDNHVGYDYQGEYPKPVQCMDLQLDKHRLVLLRIARDFLDTEELREGAEHIGLSYEECLEMAYDNIREEARLALNEGS